MLYERRHTREISDFGGLARVIPVFSLLLVVTSLASIGLPGLNGFVGEFLVLVGSFARFPWATGLAATGVIFAAAYLLWALQRIVFNAADRPENLGLSDLSPRELCVILPLIVGMVWLGLYPRPVLDRMAGAAEHYVRLVEPGLERGPAPLPSGHPQAHR
jgi:NADH-quinone oxidoreductase subunit M